MAAQKSRAVHSELRGFCLGPSVYFKRLIRLDVSQRLPPIC
jgi:hypothetical protein